MYFSSKIFNCPEDSLIEWDLWLPAEERSRPRNVGLAYLGIIDREWAVALMGVGNHARALLHYHGFVERGFRIVALFDSDPAKVGQRVDDLLINASDDMARVIRASGAELGVMTVPSRSSQAVADSLIAAGIRGLLNFAPAVLRVPPGVSVVSVDLTVQLEQLAFLVQLTSHE